MCMRMDFIIFEQNIIIVIKCWSTTEGFLFFVSNELGHIIIHSMFNINTPILTWTTRNNFSHIEEKKGKRTFDVQRYHQIAESRQNNLHSRGIEHDVVMILENVTESPCRDIFISSFWA